MRNIILNIIIALIIISLTSILLILYNGLLIDIKLKVKNTDLKYHLKVKLLLFTIITKENFSEYDEELDEEEAKDEESSENKLEKIKKLEEILSKEIKEDLKEILKLAKNSFGSIEELIYRILRNITIKNINVDLLLGLPDFITTTKIIGTIWTGRTILELFSDKIRINAIPTFEEDIIDFKLESQIKINLLIVIYHILKLLTKKHPRKLITTIISKVLKIRKFLNQIKKEEKEEENKEKDSRSE